MNPQKTYPVSFDPDKITLRFGEMEPLVIPRAHLRTRLQLVEWIYRLSGWPGMNLRRMQAFIEAVFRHHGWALPETEGDHFTVSAQENKSELLQPAVAYA